MRDSEIAPGRQMRDMIRGRMDRRLAWLAALAGMICMATLQGWAEGFRVVGPGGGGAMYNATISPHDAREVLVSCDMTGAYLSHDGGHSWRMFNLRGTVKFFAFDPVNAHVLYAGATGLWRSIDDGASWRLVWPKASKVRGVEMNSDHADETIVADKTPVGDIVALAIDPADSRTLIVGAVNNGKAAAFESRDNGIRWTKLSDLAEAPRRIWIDPRSSKGNRDLYVSGRRGLSVRVRGNWQNRPGPGAVVFTDMSAGFSAVQGVMVYATSAAGIFVSRDGGISWSASPLPGRDAKVRAIATSLNHPEIAYASYSDLKVDGRMWFGERKTWLGVAKTTDAGRSWTLVWKEDVNAAPNVHDAWITAEMGTDWGENPLELSVAEQDANLCYGTDLGRTMVTSDGGSTWEARYSKRVPGGDWTSTGLDVTTSYEYVFDPFDINRRFIAMTDVGLFRSEDKGRSWARSMKGAPERWSNTTYWVTFDPSVRGKMWGVMSGTHDLPRPKMWRHTSPTKYQGGVCYSTDGGRSWRASNSGMPETAPTHILLDPTTPPGSRTLWVAAMGYGVYKSTDDGRSWVAKNKGITQNEPLAWRLARSGDGTLYVLIARRSEDGSIGTSGDGAIYKSTDGAESWSPVKMPGEVNGPSGLAVDPRDSSRIYLAAWARAKGEQGVGGGIFLSTDGGKSWTAALDRDQHVYDVTIDPRDPNVLYGTGFQSSAWRSHDRGEHWVRMPGYNFKWGHRVMPDMEDPTMIYISTFGGGVWHGPASGGKGGVDIATPQLEPATK